MDGYMNECIVGRNEWINIYIEREQIDRLEVELIFLNDEKSKFVFYLILKVKICSIFTQYTENFMMSISRCHMSSCFTSL